MVKSGIKWNTTNLSKNKNVLSAGEFEFISTKQKRIFKNDNERLGGTGIFCRVAILLTLFNMFIGEYSHSVDDKNRISMPSKFRHNLSGGCVITRGLDHCLWVYPKEEFGLLAEKISDLPITQKNARSFSRLMLAGAVEVELDKSGRIVLPKYLLEFAKIKSKISINGVYNRIEIWPEEEWHNFKTEMENNSEDIAENLDIIGF